MKTNRFWSVRVFAVAGIAAVAAWTVATSFRFTAAQAQSANPADVTYVTSKSAVDAGKYLVLVAGCNDCHPPGYMQAGRSVPEELWLTGMPVGFKGPWGTTYPSNLRLFTAKYKSADEYVQVLRARNTRPPMPWESLHAMSDQDIKAIYAYIKSLPVNGSATPDFVAPGTDPTTPYIPFTPVIPAGTN